LCLLCLFMAHFSAFSIPAGRAPFLFTLIHPLFTCQVSYEVHLHCIINSIRPLTDRFQSEILVFVVDINGLLAIESTWYVGS